MPSLHNHHLFPQNPYPPPPQPQPIAHRVWILDCSSCGAFLTNRGMKAVLLLRPNVSLFSSDALPVNCSAFTANPDALRPPTRHKPHHHVSSRTCECLTQTLCCHSCGNTIGYMIVIPCTRCTSSISATNRATNGHRFVFHSSEVTGTERHYIKDEPGVIPFDPAPTHFAPAPHYSPTPRYAPIHHNDDPPSPPDDEFPSPSLRSEYLPTPPLEFARPLPPNSRHQSPEPEFVTSHYRIRSPPYSNPSLARSHPHSTPHSHSQQDLFASPDSTPPPPPPPLPHSSYFPQDHKDLNPLLPSLRPGEVIFWHHLARSGEIPGVTDDIRARDPSLARMTGLPQTSLLFNR